MELPGAKMSMHGPKSLHVDRRFLESVDATAIALGMLAKLQRQASSLLFADATVTVIMAATAASTAAFASLLGSGHMLFLKPQLICSTAGACLFCTSQSMQP